MLFFLGEPIFEIEVWRDGEKVLARPVELDLVGIGEDLDEAVAKLGSLIAEYADFLIDEGDERTEAEQELLDLILARMGPPLMHYHMRRSRLTRILNLVRHMVRSEIFWGTGPSTLVRHDKVLHV